MTDTTELEAQAGALRDAALLEMTEQENLIEALRQQITSAQAHHRSLEGEARRLARAVMILQGVADVGDRRVDTHIEQRRKALSRSEHVDATEPGVG